MEIASEGHAVKHSPHLMQSVESGFSKTFMSSLHFFLTGSAFCAFFRINLYSQNGHLVKNSVNGSKRTDVSAKRSVNNDRKYNGKDKNQKFPFK